MDSDIRVESAKANDFASFLDEHSLIEQILFNGKKAEQLFHRLVPASHCQQLDLIGLPSTSPAYAAMPFKGKLDIWKDKLALVRKPN